MVPARERVTRAAGWWKNSPRAHVQRAINVLDVRVDGLPADALAALIRAPSCRSTPRLTSRRHRAQL